MRTPARIAIFCLFAFAAARADDLDVVRGARSDTLTAREAELALALDQLRQAQTGTSFSASVSPSFGWEQDLGRGRDVEFETGLSVSGQVVYRFDARSITTATAAVLRAEARVRAQHRTDIERGLLALSALRLALRSLADARTAVEALQSETSAEPEAGALAELEARTAALDLRQAEESVRAQLDLLAGLGLDGPGALEETYFVLAIGDPADHPQAQLLRVKIERAYAGLRQAELAFIPTLAVTGRYEDSGVTTTARAALATGRPEVSLGVGYRSDDDRSWSVGVEAQIRLRDSDLRGLSEAQAALLAAERELVEFLNSQPQRARSGRETALIAEEGFALALLTLELAERTAAAAASGSETESRRALQALRRADDAAERAWQRYVRSVADHLAVTEGEWQVREVEQR